jgi:NitT/TauT family transport system permease protein
MTRAAAEDPIDDLPVLDSESDDQPRIRWIVTRAAPVVATFIVAVVAWQLIVVGLHVPPYILPAPTEIVSSLVGALGTPSLYADLGATTAETLGGFAISAAAAIVVGVLIGEVRFIERIVLPYIIAFESMPKIALAPLLLIWFGFGIVSKTAMATLVCFFPIVMNVIEGMRRTRPEEIDMLRAFGANRWQVFLRCKLRNALPLIFAGLDIGIIFALLGSIVGEFVGANVGLGYRILTYNSTFNIASMFAILIILSVMGFIGHTAIRVIRRYVVFWERPTDTSTGRS